MSMWLQLVSVDTVNITHSLKVILIKGLEEITEENRIVNTPMKSLNIFSSILPIARLIDAKSLNYVILSLSRKYRM